MRLFTFLLPFIAIISTITSVSAASYRVSVSSSLAKFSLDSYHLSSGKIEYYSRNVDGKSDPVLENYPWKNFIEGAFSQGGSMRFTEVFYGPSAYPDDNTYWRGSDCTGVFAMFGRCESEFQGHLTEGFIDLTSSSYWYVHRISAASGAIDMATDLDYHWHNALGENYTNNGETVSHRIERINISPVPVPASGLLMLLSLVGLGGARMMRRR